ncbi:MAG: hypothetical protein AB7N76_16180 [Planctomycetota bacterium]
MRATFPLLISLALLTPAFAQDPAPPAPPKPQPEGKQDGQKPGETPRRGPPRFGGGDPSDMSKQVVEFLTKELDLSESQGVQVKKIMDEAMDEVWQKAAEFFGSGDPESMDKARKLFEGVRVTISKRISEVLTDAQRREFEVLVENFDRRAESFEESRRVRDDVSQLLNPKPQSKTILLGKAERLLFLSQDETRVLLPYVEKVVDARLALYEGRRVRRKDLLNASLGGAKKTELAQRVSEIRAAEQFQQLELAAAQQRLKELLTLEQEVRFVAAGILD